MMLQSGIWLEALWLMASCDSKVLDTKYFPLVLWDWLWCVLYNAICSFSSWSLSILSTAPSPTTAVHYLATKCVDAVKTSQKDDWFMPWGPDQCSKIRDFEEATAKRIEANNIVFAVHIPLPHREMSPWFQFMLVILQFDIAFKMHNQIGEYKNGVWLLYEHVCLYRLYKLKREDWEGLHEHSEEFPILFAPKVDWISHTLWED